jgi:tetratricopeptide (TPR) repeat protein
MDSPETTLRDLWVTPWVLPLSKIHQHAATAACWLFVVCTPAQVPVSKPNVGELARADMGLGKIGKPQSTESPKASALAHYGSALCLESNTFIREALPHYQKVLAADPSNAELAYYVAELAVNYANRATAVQLLETQIQRQGQLPAHWLNLVRFHSTYVDAFDKDKPAQLLEQSLKRFPQSAEVYTAAVVHELQEKNRTKALSLMQQAQSQAVSQPAYWLDMGKVAQEVWPLAHPELRDQHREKVNPFFAKAQELALKPDNKASRDVTLTSVAQYYVASNQLPLATTTTEALIKVNRSATTLRLLARLYEAGEKAEAAYPLLEEITQLEPNDADAHRRLMAHYLEQQDFPASLPHAEALVRLGGTNSSDYWRLGQLHLALKDSDAALKVARRAMALFPNNPQLHLLAADCLRSQRRTTEALKSIEQAEALAQATQPDVLSSDFYSRWADLLQSTKQFDEAAAKYQKAITLVPEDAPKSAAVILNNLGYMWLEQGRNLDQAGDFISRAVKLEPESPVYLDSLGWFFFLKGNNTRALEILLDVEKRMGQEVDSEILDHVGQVYERMKDVPNAKAYYERALKLDPKNGAAKNHMDRLLGRFTF